jgi:hypothetical protein
VPSQSRTLQLQMWNNRSSLVPLQQTDLTHSLGLLCPTLLIRPLSYGRLCSYSLPLCRFTPSLFPFFCHFFVVSGESRKNVFVKITINSKSLFLFLLLFKNYNFMLFHTKQSCNLYLNFKMSYLLLLKVLTHLQELKNNLSSGNFNNRYIQPHPSLTGLCLLHLGPSDQTCDWSHLPNNYITKLGS